MPFLIPNQTKKGRYENVKEKSNKSRQSVQKTIAGIDCNDWATVGIRDVHEYCMECAAPEIAKGVVDLLCLI